MVRNYLIMPAAKLGVLIAVFFLTSVVIVVTGSRSLTTVPVMIAFGIEPHIAIATNMLALTLMSVGGSVPFFRSGAIRRDHLLVSVDKSFEEGAVLKGIKSGEVGVSRKSVPKPSRTWRHGVLTKIAARLTQCGGQP
jgi:hypothetical protein